MLPKFEMSTEDVREGRRERGEAGGRGRGRRKREGQEGKSYGK